MLTKFSRIIIEHRICVSVCIMNETFYKNTISIKIFYLKIFVTLSIKYIILIKC